MDSKTTQTSQVPQVWFPVHVPSEQGGEISSHLAELGGFRLKQELGADLHHQFFIITHNRINYILSQISMGISFLLLL